MRGKGLARILGFLGGILVLVGSIFTFFFDIAFAAIDRSVREGLAGTATAIEQFVFAILILVFVAFAGAWWPGRSMAGGIVLIVISVLGLILLGSGILVVIGFVLALIAGILFLIPRI